jgi:anaerobic magnesium-protoporphyrin IX monomethyl ester cyclase
MKILLIQPPMTLFPWEKLSPTPPLGLAYLAGYLESKGYDVRIIDAFAEARQRGADKTGLVHFGLSWEEIAQRIAQEKPDLVGINSLFSSQAVNMLKVARLVKEYDKDVPVVVGGAHPSSVPQDVLRNSQVDFVVIGEGEYTFELLIRSLNGPKGIETIDGIGYRVNGKVKVSPKTSYIPSLDDLPFPARHLLRMELYGSSRSAEQMRSPCTTIVTSRGCPMNCVFCSIHSVFGRKWRGRSPENVIAELKLLVDTYKIREIQFEDDNVALDKQRMAKICDLMVKERLDLKWSTPNGIAIWNLDAPLLQKMKRSGCYSLSFAIESGDPQTLKFIGKPINLPKAKEVIKQANKTGFFTHGFFVFGFPHETRTSIMNTLNFAVNSDLDVASFFIASPYPATRLYELMKKENMLKYDYWEQYRVSKASADTEFFTREELDALQTELYTAFFKKRFEHYFMPKTFVSRIGRLSSIDDFRFIARMGMRFVNILKKQ